MVEIEILEHRQQLKIYRIPLERYLGKRKIEWLKCKVKLSTNIQLKTLLCWFINENWLREVQKTDNKQGSTIVITVKGVTKTKKRYVSELCFSGLNRVVENYWKARPSSVCMTYYGISHEQIKDCRDRLDGYVVCTNLHKIEKH